MAASIQPNGSGVAGTQTAGVTKHFQTTAKTSSASAIETIMGNDSGTILGHVQPGGAGQKLVDGTMQRAHQILADSTPGVTGNHILPTSGVGVATPTLPTGYAAADGLSNAQGRE